MATIEVSENPGSCNNGNCSEHFHFDDPVLSIAPTQSTISAGSGYSPSPSTEKAPRGIENQQNEHGFRRIIRNFTPSWFIITMSTGVVSIILHQLPYNGHWLQIVSYIFFVLNIFLFALFTLITCLRYILYPQIFPAVLHHPHQSLFLATFPVGLATIINMIVLVCVPAWGHGMAIFAWVLWWIDSALALTTCFHLSFVIMSSRRSELAEMTALYLIPIVTVIIAATSGGLIAGQLLNHNHQLMTLVICYVLWGLGTPLSWIILTLYFLRMTVHRPLQREVIVSLLLPIGPLGLAGFSIILFGKLARHLFPLTHTLPHTVSAGETFYTVGILLGLLLWGFAILWFIIAIIMMAVSGGFPFNMGWWGFVFPVGVFTLLTTSIGEELESRFFKVLSCVLTAASVLMWLVIAVRTIKRSITGQMFYAPCLGTDLYQKAPKIRKSGGKSERETA